jgi:hypothetical protein
MTLKCKHVSKMVSDQMINNAQNIHSPKTSQVSKVGEMSWAKK